MPAGGGIAKCALPCHFCLNFATRPAHFARAVALSGAGRIETVHVVGDVPVDFAFKVCRCKAPLSRFAASSAL